MINKCQQRLETSCRELAALNTMNERFKFGKVFGNNQFLANITTYLLVLEGFNTAD